MVPLRKVVFLMFIDTNQLHYSQWQLAFVANVPFLGGGAVSVRIGLNDKTTLKLGHVNKFMRIFF